MKAILPKLNGGSDNVRVIPKSLISIVALSVLSAAAAAPLQFGGISFSPGSTVNANVPLNAQEKSLAAQGGNTVPSNAVAVLATPANFDPRRTWPVLVICSTSDNKRQNRDDLADFYRGLRG